MSEVNKNNKEFEFIKEEILPKKRRKFRKWFLPFLMTVIMAIIFGLVAALTFCIAEPRLYKLLHKDDPKALITPTPNPDGHESDDDTEEPEDDSDDKEINNDKSEDEPNGQAEDSDSLEDDREEPDTIVVETIEADINDYVSIYTDIRKMLEQTEKSILTVSSIIDGKDWFGNVLEKRVYTTGVIIEKNSSNLMVLLSLDRVKDASIIKIELNEAVAVDAVLHDYDSELNLAIISVNTADIPIKLLGDLAAIKIGESYSLMVGSPIIALGNPNGYPGSMDMGIVTSKGSVISVTDNELELFNTNTVFNKESDGVIINLKGELVGLITRNLKNELDIELSTAISISRVKSYIEKMKNQQARIYCGVIAENLPQAAMQDYNVTRGIYIYEVKKDSPAFNAGLKSGDIILNVGERFIFNMNNFYNAISELEPKSQITFKIKRTSDTSDKEIEVQIVLEGKKQ